MDLALEYFNELKETEEFKRLIPEFYTCYAIK